MKTSACPNCAAGFLVPDQALGRRALCPHCWKDFEIRESPHQEASERLDVNLVDGMREPGQSEEKRTCPLCAMQIPKAAVRCAYCQSDLRAPGAGGRAVVAINWSKDAVRLRAAADSVGWGTIGLNAILAGLTIVGALTGMPRELTVVGLSAALTGICLGWLILAAGNGLAALVEQGASPK